MESDRVCFKPVVSAGKVVGELQERGRGMEANAHVLLFVLPLTRTPAQSASSDHVSTLSACLLVVVTFCEITDWVSDKVFAFFGSLVRRLSLALPEVFVFCHSFLALLGRPVAFCLPSSYAQSARRLPGASTRVPTKLVHRGGRRRCLCSSSMAAARGWGRSWTTDQVRR